MTKEQLKKYVEQEAHWLQYYVIRASKDLLTKLDENFYETVNSIGYTKRVIPLDRRCPATMLTSPNNVKEDDISQMFEIGEPRNHSKNVYTPLEIWTIKYKEETLWLLELIKR